MMLRKLFPYIILVAGVLFFWYLAYEPVVWNLNHVPQNRVYLGGDDYPIDMLGNLLLVREGYNGHWLQYANITTDFPSPKYFLKEEYILIGQLARLTRTDPLFMFHLTRLILSFGYILTIFAVLRIFFTSVWERVAGFFLVAFGGSFFLPSEASRQFLWGLVYDALPVVRLTQAAHHYLLAGMFTLLSITFLSQAIDDRKKTFSFFAAVISGIAVSFFYPPDTVLIIGSFPFFLISWLFVHRKMPRLKAHFFRIIALLGIFSEFAFIPLLYMRYLLSSVWDANLHTVLEPLNPFTISVGQFVLLMGLVYVFAWFSLRTVFREKKTAALLFVPWLIVFPLVEFIVSDIATLNRIRVFLSPYFVIFGILAVWGIGETVLFIKKLPFLRRTPGAILGSLLIVGILTSGIYTFTVSYFDRQRLCFCADHNFGYPTHDLMNAFSWLSRHTGEHDTVLSAFDAGLMIPAFSGNEVYTSWWYRLTDMDEMKRNYMQYMSFYNGSMSESQAHEFLEKEAISYVFLSEEERQIRPKGAEFNYPFLKPVFRAGKVLIYKVI